MWEVVSFRETERDREGERERERQREKETKKEIEKEKYNICTIYLLNLNIVCLLLYMLKQIDTLNAYAHIFTYICVVISPFL